MTDSALTQCPHCDTVFQVSDEQLSVAQGRVRCGRCQGVFDALAHLYEEEAPDTDADTAPAPTPREPHASADTWDADEPDDTPYIVASRDDESEDVAPPESAEPAAAASVDTAPPEREVRETATEADADVPAEAAVSPASATPRVESLPRIDIVEVLRAQLEVRATPRAAPVSLVWPLLAVLLMVSLGGQYLYFARADLAQYQALRPWLQRACTYLGCDLPLRRAPEQIELLSRDVISHPRIRNALLISATFVNRADFIQVYPVLQISLSNESGTVVAMRRFQPEEYLAQGARIAAGMALGVPVHVVLEVVEPKHSATSFQFEFL